MLEKTFISPPLLPDNASREMKVVFYSLSNDTKNNLGAQFYYSICGDSMRHASYLITKLQIKLDT